MSSATPTQDANAKFNGYAVKKKGLLGGVTFEPYEWHPRPLGPNDVELRITHAGICASDHHIVTGGWNNADYPVVPGHEIVAVCTQTGPAVTTVRVGQRVGVGPFVHACQKKECEQCSEGHTNWCGQAVQTYNDKMPDGEKTYGGYASHVRVREDFAFDIPEVISSESAAPLLCAGVTTYAPLKRHGAGPGKRVGVIGVGGLGHLAIQFASKMGAHVVAMSHSGSKAGDAIKLGASEHVNMSEEAETKKLEKSLDLVLCSANAKGMNFEKYLGLVKPGGTFVLVAVPEEKLNFMPFSLIMSSVKLAGSLVGSIEETKEMLDFAAKHGVRAWTEQMPMKDVNEAYKKFNAGEARYRLVLTN